MNICPLSPEVKLVLDECRLKGLLNEDFVTNFLRRANTELPLKIALIGKMKAGKSSLINALIFQNEVLAADVKPLTAVLTKISYNEEEQTSITVNFFNEQDIRDMEQSSDEAIQEQLTRLKNITDWKQQLGTVDKEISLEELKEYTVAGGQYSPIVKEVNIKYHHDALRGLCIYDTPGFNDPVRSRVEATKVAVSTCQILIFAHDTTSHYDIVEKNMLLSQVAFAQTSKMVDVITKVDTCNDIDEWDNIIEYLNQGKQSIIQELGEQNHIAKLLSDSQIYYVSALMGLIGYKRQRSEVLNDFEKMVSIHICQLLDISEPSEFILNSNIATLCDHINNLANQKEKFIASSFPNELRGELLKSIQDLQRKISADESLKNTLCSSVDIIKQEIHNVQEIRDMLMSKFKSNKLYSELCSMINAKGDSLIIQRDTLSKREFTTENYPEGSIFNSERNNNYSRYTKFVKNFTTDLRLNLIDFKSNFATCVREYIRTALNEILVSLKLSLNDINYYTETIINCCDQIISEITISIPSHTLSGPIWDNPQDAEYSNDFDEYFTDSRIRDLLYVFKTSAKSFIWNDEVSKFQMQIFDATENLSNKLKGAIEDPTEKMKELEDISSRIDINKKRIAAIEQIIEKYGSIFNM